MNRRQISGWGRSTWSLTEVKESLGDQNMVHIPRGLGRSYGDCAAVTGGITLLNQGGKEITLEDDVVTVGARVSLEDLLDFSIQRGLFLPVSPGTRYVSIGGAVAADVHGKNHHRSGSFGNHVLGIELEVRGNYMWCSPSENPETYWATIGGMGLTGVIQRIKLRLKKVPSPWIRRRDLKAQNFDTLITRLSTFDQDHEYSVAWIDTLAKKKSFGRGVITLGNHEGRSRKGSLPQSSKPRISIPVEFPSWVLNKHTMRPFNNAWYSLRAREAVERDSDPYTFFYPLDFIGEWNRIYGKRGFIQYQFVVPFSEVDTLKSIIEDLSRRSVPVFLSVLKRFGPGNSGLLSFPMEGWTLAIDIPTDFDGLATLLDNFDERVQPVGGRVYLAKDSRVSRSTFEKMYLQVEHFRSIRRDLGIVNSIQSDLSRRLAL